MSQIDFNAISCVVERLQSNYSRDEIAAVFGEATTAAGEKWLADNPQTEQVQTAEEKAADAALAADNARLSQENAELRARAGELDGQVGELSDQLQQANDALATATAENAAMQKRLAELTPAPEKKPRGRPPKKTAA